MKNIILLLILSLFLNACMESEENNMVQLDGPILESVNSEGDIEFNGSVTNLSDNPVESVYIVIILKDSQGNILKADSMPLFDDEDGLLYPQQREFFSIVVEADPNKIYTKDVEIYYDEVSPSG